MVAAALGSTLAMAGQPKRVPVTVGVAIALLAPVLTGHTRSFEPGWLMMASDAVHLYAAAVWAGGLVGITLLTRRHRSEFGVLVSRIGRLAAWSLAAVLLSGLTLAWTLHRSWDSLTGSGHGRLILLKLAVVLAVAGVGAFNRYRLVPALAAAGAKARRMLADPALHLVILDELNIVLRKDYLPVAEVVDGLLGKRPDLHVVVTGRNAKPELLAAADLVTEMTLVKHPFRSGVKAQLGIEY